MKNTFFCSLTILAFCSCDNDRLQSSIQNPAIDTNVSDTAKIYIDYTQLTCHQGKDQVFQFKAPKDLFVVNSTDDKVFYAEKLNATIHFMLTETSQVDAPDAIRKKEDLIVAMKKNMEVTFTNEDQNTIIVSGKLPNNMISYKKGIYFKPKDNYFGESGRNTQPFCFTGTLVLDYPANHQEEFEKLIPMIMESFKCDFSKLYEDL